MMAWIPYQLEPERSMYRTDAEYLEARNRYMILKQRRERQYRFHHAFMLTIGFVILAFGLLAFALPVYLQFGKAGIAVMVCAVGLVALLIMLVEKTSRRKAQ